MVDHLWTPWRYQYISIVDKSVGGCVFCTALQAGDDEKVHIVYRGKSCFVILNRYPYNPGHVMMVPYRHIALLSEASLEEIHELMDLTQFGERVLGEVYAPQGYNMGMNIGRSAGAGIDGHIHLHLLPRWAGDTNFISVVGETRVLPEDLAITYRKLADCFSRFGRTNWAEK